MVTKNTTPNKRTSAPKTQSASTASEPTSAKAWKQKAVGGTLVTVPSGNTALVRTPGMTAFLENGTIPNALMPYIQDAMSSGTTPKDEATESLLKDPEMMQQIFKLADKITVECCIDPKVSPAPTHDVDGVEVVIPIGDPARDGDLLYVDEVDFADKMFIFNFAVGGSTEALAPFRT